MNVKTVSDIMKKKGKRINVTKIVLFIALH